MSGRASDEKWYVRIGTTILCATSLMSAAIWNGYPIVYSDTASYIISGFHLETLIDRPITYGLFIRVCSLNGWSLWTVALAQSMLLAHVVGLSLRSLGIDKSIARAAIIIPAALFTGLPFVCGQIITDTFTPILLFTLYLLFFTRASSSQPRWTLFGIFLLSFSMHMSHIPITAALLLVALTTRRMMERRSLPVVAWSTVGIILLLSGAGVLVMGTSLAKSKNTFFAARMAEAGILQRYLDEHCGSTDLKLCSRKGNIPFDANAFLWDKDTPLNVFSSRQEMEDELGRIARGSLAEAPLAWLHVKAALTSISSQLTRFAVGDGNGDFRQGTVLHERIQTFFPSELTDFDSARQMTNSRFHGPLALANRIYNLTMLISLLCVVTCFLLRGRWRSSSSVRCFVIYLLGGLALNVGVNAGLVMVADRFGTKTAWLLPFMAIVLVCASIPALNKRFFQPVMA